MSWLWPPTPHDEIDFADIPAQDLAAILIGGAFGATLMLIQASAGTGVCDFAQKKGLWLLQSARGPELVGRDGFCCEAAALQHIDVATYSLLVSPLCLLCGTLYDTVRTSSTNWRIMLGLGIIGAGTCLDVRMLRKPAEQATPLRSFECD